MENQYIFGDYVLTGIKNAFIDRISFWLSKKDTTIALYCFSLPEYHVKSGNKEFDDHMNAIDGYISMFETRLNGFSKEN